MQPGQQQQHKKNNNTTIKKTMFFRTNALEEYMRVYLDKEPFVVKGKQTFDYLLKDFSPLQSKKVIKNAPK